MRKEETKGYIKPSKIWGPIYFVGIHAASTHIINTGDGLILIDPGYPEHFWIILENIRELGFDVRDIKKIVLSHGHLDHAGAVNELVSMTGALTYLGKDDLDMVTGKLPPVFKRREGFMENYAFTPDVLLSDGDKVELGNISMTFVTTPGHTDGTLSFFFDVTDGERTYRAGMHGGVGLNTLTREFLESHNLPLSNRDVYLASLEKVRGERVDIPLGNHVGQNNTEGKLIRVAEGDSDAFIAPDEWNAFLDKCALKMQEMIEKEASEAG